MVSCLRDRMWVGVHLTRLALDSYGTVRFWDVIGWWHGEVHYTIPRIEEERRVAAELERTFADNPFGTLTLNTNVTANINSNPCITFGNASIVFKDSKIVVDPGKLSVGQWQYQGIAIRTGARPNPVRRLLIGVLTGAEWVGDGKSNRPPAPEYERLAEFIGSLQS
jgi:hypothetical protein